LGTTRRLPRRVEPAHRLPGHLAVVLMVVTDGELRVRQAIAVDGAGNVTVLTLAR